MTSMNAEQFIERRIQGFHFKNANTETNQHALSQLVKKDPAELVATLYDAVVGLHQGSRLGSCLNAQAVVQLGDVANGMLRSYELPLEAKSALAEFSETCQLYRQLLATKPGNKQARVLRKTSKYQNGQLIERGRHTLRSVDGKIYEQLTWLTQPELDRIQSRFSDNCKLTLQKVGARQVKRFGQEVREFKSQLGEGGFARTGLARWVNEDQYLVVRKMPFNSSRKEEGIQQTILPGLNDGTQPRLVKTYDSLIEHSTRVAQSESVSSYYEFMEAGIVDMEDFIAKFQLLRFAFDPANHDSPDAIDIKMAMVQKAARKADDGDIGTASQKAVNEVLSNPLSSPRVGTQFQNRLAYQMLQAINQMHQAGFSHNDIKPNNFVFAFDEQGLLVVKLIDFNLSEKIEQGIGRARQLFCLGFAAPQVGKSDATNHPIYNDAYSAGNTFRFLLGMPMSALEDNFWAAKNFDQFGKDRAHKTVSDRKDIEAKHKVIPEMAVLSELCDLLCHPKMSRRYTVKQALASPVFTQPQAMLSAQEFDRIGRILLKQSHFLNKQQHLGPLLEADGKNHESVFATRINGETAQAEHDRAKQAFIERYGEKVFKKRLGQLKSLRQQGSREAVIQRVYSSLTSSHSTSQHSLGL